MLDAFTLIAVLVQAASFLSNNSPCLPESIHRHVLTWANKLYHYASTYYGRVMFSCCIFNKGWQWTLQKVYDKLGISVSPTLAVYLKDRDEDRAKNKLRMAGEAYRKQTATRVMHREAVRSLNAASTKTNTTLYGYSYLQDWSSTFKELKQVEARKGLIAPPASKVQKVLKKMKDAMQDEEEKKKIEEKKKNEKSDVCSPKRKKRKTTQKKKKRSVDEDDDM